MDVVSHPIVSLCVIELSCKTPIDLVSVVNERVFMRILLSIFVIDTAIFIVNLLLIIICIHMHTSLIVNRSQTQ